MTSDKSKRRLKEPTIKTHRFILDVKTVGSRLSAEIRVLTAFAKRYPDGCEFLLRRKAPKKA